MQNYDVIIIGGGPAGLVASKILVAMGKKTAIVERHKLGGDCTHFGCVPSKTLLKAATSLREAKSLSKYGLKTNELKIDVSGVLKHTLDVVDEIYSHETPEIFEKAGVHIIEGHANFINKNQIIVNGKTYQSKKFIIASGAKAKIPNIKGIKDINYLTNENIFLQKEIPSSMLIIGTGAIGIEMAYAFNAFGTEVTVLSRAEGILKDCDKEISDILKNELEKQGITFLQNLEFIEAYEIDNIKYLNVKSKDEKLTLSASELLLASGRAANLDMNLEKAEVFYTKEGVSVNEYLQTSNTNIYSMGDVSSKYKFTHIAEQEAIIAASNIALPIRKKVSYKNIGFCIFASPQIAQIGLNEIEAKKIHGAEVQSLKFEYKNSDRGYTDNNKIGIIKVNVLKSGKILGASIIGSNAGELIHILQLAKTFEISFEKLSKMVFLYPTYADIIKQPSKQFYIKKLLNNPILKVLKKLKSMFTKA